MAFGCAEGADGEPIVDPNNVPVLIPASALAAVQIDGTFFFPNRYDPDLYTCMVLIPDLLDVDEATARDLRLGTMIATFERALPPGTDDDYFSIQIQDDGSVLWGLFVKGPVEGHPDALGKEWSNRPGGMLTTNCKYEVLVDEPYSAVRCSVLWEGEATEKFTFEVVENARVEVECRYITHPLCDFICNDYNQCTDDACVLDVGCVHAGREEGSFCQPMQGDRGICNADAKCVYPDDL
jgi:hypothetical protein